MIRAMLLASCLVLAAPALAAPGGSKGTDVLHLTLRSTLTLPEPDPTAATVGGMMAEGEVALMLRQQGNADIQRLELDVHGLAPDTSHHLWALLRGQMAPVDVLAFDSDENGEASLRLMKGQLPAALDPLVDVLALEIHDDMDQNVLEVDLSSPDFLQYLVKRELDNDGVDDDAAGTLYVKANSDKARLRLAAANLEPGASYTLVVDGNVVATENADEQGRLKADVELAAEDALGIGVVELHDGADQSVLSTELP